MAIRPAADQTAPLEAMRSAALAPEGRDEAGLRPGEFAPREAVEIGGRVIEAIEINDEGRPEIRARDASGSPAVFTVEAYQISSDGVFVRAVDAEGAVLLLDCGWAEAKALHAILLMDGETADGVELEFRPSI